METSAILTPNAAVTPHREDPISLPRLKPGQRLDLKAVRDHLEMLYLSIVLIPTIVIVTILATLGVMYDFGLTEFMIIVGAILVYVVLAYVSWKLMFAFIHGNSIRVGPYQYPQIYELVREASDILGIDPPTVLVMQGHGLFEVLIAKRFSKKGFVILTSNLIDELSRLGSSRELMFFIGRQLGLIATGYFRFWFVKSVVGRLAWLFHFAWERRVHFTADRLGLLVAGDLIAAEQALIIITAGVNVAPSTNIDALREQRREHFASPWSWVYLAFSPYPYIIDRILRLREFAFSAASRGVQGNAPVAVGTLPIAHRQIRSIPIMLIHGHDREARLALENYFFRRLPHVAPVAMIQESDAASTLPEKFETLAERVRGAVAILTPDDLAISVSAGIGGLRPRQNVVVELGWFWGRLGRERCLLLTRGVLELPSDLQGVDVHTFSDSPVECSDVLHDFVRSLDG